MDRARIFGHTGMVKQSYFAPGDRTPPRFRARASLRRAMALTDATNAASAPTSAVKMNHLRARCATRPSSRRADATRRDDATTRRDANAD